MWATGGSAAWENMTSTGAAFEGEGFFETLWVDNTFPVLASRTVTVSPASPKSDGFTVLVIMTRSMPLWMLMPCGELIKGGPGGGALMVLMGLSFVPSPMITAAEPMQWSDQVRLTCEKE